MYTPSIRMPNASFMPSGGAYRPSGALSSSQVLDYQGALVALGHMPASAVTGREPVADSAVLRSFQTNYNGEQATHAYRYSPRTLTVDGQWGANTQAALQNYVAWSRTVLPNIAAMAAVAANPTVLPTDGYGSGPGLSINPIGGQVPGSATSAADKAAASTPAAVAAKLALGVSPTTTSKSTTTATPTPVTHAIAPVGAPPVAGTGAAAASTIPWAPILVTVAGLGVIGVVAMRKKKPARASAERESNPRRRSRR